MKVGIKAPAPDGTVPLSFCPVLVCDSALRADESQKGFSYSMKVNAKAPAPRVAVLL